MTCCLRNEKVYVGPIFASFLRKRRTLTFFLGIQMVCFGWGAYVEQVYVLFLSLTQIVNRDSLAIQIELPRNLRRADTQTPTR